MWLNNNALAAKASAVWEACTIRPAETAVIEIGASLADAVDACAGFAALRARACHFFTQVDFHTNTVSRRGRRYGFLEAVRADCDWYANPRSCGRFEGALDAGFTAPVS